jgi:hypothetical protein
MENFTPLNANDLTAQVCKSAQYSVQLLGSLNNARFNNELLTELYDRLSAVENILRSFILRLESPILSSLSMVMRCMNFSALPSEITETHVLT